MMLLPLILSLQLIMSIGFSVWFLFHPMLNGRNSAGPMVLLRCNSRCAVPATRQWVWHWEWPCSARYSFHWLLVEREGVNNQLVSSHLHFVYDGSSSQSFLGPETADPWKEKNKTSCCVPTPQQSINLGLRLWSITSLLHKVATIAEFKNHHP